MLAGLSELVYVLGLSDDELRVGCLQLLEDFGGGVERVGGGRDGADHGSAHECEHELGAVLEKDHDHIAFVDAELG